MTRYYPLLAVLIGFAAPLAAQQPPATTSELNNQVGADTAMANAVDQGQYQADMLAYRNAVAAHSAATMQNQTRYGHQQALYADAMAAWRKQVADCKAGHAELCKNPEPDPKDFY